MRQPPSGAVCARSGRHAHGRETADDVAHRSGTSAEYKDAVIKVRRVRRSTPRPRKRRTNCDIIAVGGELRSRRHTLPTFARNIAAVGWMWPHTRRGRVASLLLPAPQWALCDERSESPRASCEPALARRTSPCAQAKVARAVRQGKVEVRSALRPAYVRTYVPVVRIYMCARVLYGCALGSTQRDCEERCAADRPVLTRAHAHRRSDRQGQTRRPGQSSATFCGLSAAV